MKKVNTHCHTVGASRCGEVSPEDVVTIYGQAGYDGLIITNHYTREGFDTILEGKDDLSKARSFLALTRRAQKRGDDVGLRVLLGMELNLSRYNRQGQGYPVYEFLIYGVTEEFILKNPRMFEWSQEEAFERFDQAGALMIQAHPFRPKTRVADPFFEHGIELYNGHPGHNSHNDLSAGFAACHPHLLVTAGDDFHRAETFGYAGMFFPNDTKTIFDTVRAIKDGTASIFVTGKTDPTIVRKKL